jgi:hypothetical protein
MAIATVEHLLNQGVISESYSLPLDDYLIKAERRVISLLRQDWWNKYTKQNPVYNQQKLNPTLLKTTEWQDIVCDYALAYIILPKLADALTRERQQQIAQCHQSFEQAYRARIEFGFTYDEFNEHGIDIMPEQEVDYLRMR